LPDNNSVDSFVSFPDKMSATSTTLVGVITPTLELEPYANFQPWRRSVFREYSGALQGENIGEPSGMIFLLLSPAEWEIYAAIPVADRVHGGPTFRPVPNFDMPAALANNANAVAISVHREATRIAGVQNRLRHALRQALITSIGHRNERRLVNPITSTVDLSIHEIMTAMARDFDTMTPAIATQLQAALNAPLLSSDVETYRDHCTAFNEVIAQLDRAGQAPAPVTQFSTFVASCSAQPAVGSAVTLFSQLYPTIAAQRLDNLQDYILTQLRSITVAAVGYANVANAVANATVADPVAAAMISDLRDEIKQLKADAARASRAGGGGSSSPRAPPPFYCYLHGPCHHAGTSCTMMRDGIAKGVKTVFTNAMKKAKHPTDVPAGVPPGKA
jgi:hypothetical protein